MKSRTAVFVLVLFAVCSSHGQIGAQRAGTPAGTFFTESFGDTGTQPCGYGAPWNLGLYQYTGCSVIWGSAVVGTSGSISITASPGMKAYPQGPNSLKIVTGSSATYLRTAGFTPTVSSSTAFDVRFTLYVAATGLAQFHTQSVYSFVPGSGNPPCFAEFQSPSAGSISIAGSGSSSSAGLPLTLNADHTVFMHCAPGGAAGSSYISLDGGAQQTFTANATSWVYQAVGEYTGNTDNVTYYIGNVQVNAPTQAAGNGPTMYNNFETSTNGTQVTPAIMAASTHGGTGTYTCTSGSYQTISTAAQLNLIQPVTVLGTQYTDAGATRGLSFAYAGSTGTGCYYNWVSFSPVVSMFQWVETTLPTTDQSTYASMDPVSNTAGSDFVSHMQLAGDIYIESSLNPNGNPDIGSFFPYTAATKYGMATQFQRYAAGSVPGGVYLVQGKTASGTFVTGETLTQTGSGATAQLLISPAGNNAMQVKVISGTATATGTWTGLSSGAAFTPTSLPTTFHTIKIYDQNCRLLSVQMKVANPSSPSSPSQIIFGRGGDQNSSTVTGNWYEDNVLLDYASGGTTACQ